MVATTLLKKSPYLIEWMTQADPSRETSKVKKMNSRLLLLSLSKMAH